MPSTTKLTQRQQIHERNYHDARAAARRLLAEHGLARVTMSAVAREIGIAGPGMYRYFQKRAGLIEQLYNDTLDELVEFLYHANDAQDVDDYAARLHATTHALFIWCRVHRNEFELLMGHGFKEAVGGAEQIRTHVAHRIGSAFVPTFDAMWRSGAEYPSDGIVPPGLANELTEYKVQMLKENQDLADDFPLGAVRLMLVCWRQIYGLLCMVAYDHLNFAFGNFDNTFHDMITSLIGYLGMPLSDRVVLSTID